MKISLLAVGRTDSTAIEGLIGEYEKRLKRFADFSREELPDVKNARSLSEKEQKAREGTDILSRIKPSDHVLLLDERGKQFSSPEFAESIQKHLNSGIKNLIFVIGGPYGFSEEVYQRANGLISLSKMTFSHQMVRLFFTEQLYRAFAILNGLPYHHQ